jgi:hypothetical protein
MVRIVGRFLQCDLDRKRAYGLMEAYKREPHIAFMNVKSESELASFVKTWGPLCIPDTSPKGTSWLLLNDYWTCQRYLKATAHLLRAFHDRRGEKEALAEFLTARGRQYPGETAPIAPLEALMWLQNDSLFCTLVETHTGDELQVGNILFEWNERTDSRCRHRLIAFLIEHTFQGSARIVADWGARRPRLEVLWDLNNLETALAWMVYQDTLTGHIPQPCPECLEAFRPSFRHSKKFCSYDCAHRAAARKWRRKDLRKKKLSARKEKK